MGDKKIYIVAKILTSKGALLIAVNRRAKQDACRVHLNRCEQMVSKLLFWIAPSCTRNMPLTVTLRI